jgi:LPPG:FO 2-phospho-L-lactate transferase
MEALERLGGETWFRLGDRDLALHLERSRRLAAGESLSDITDGLRRQLGIQAEIAPMTDDPVRTKLRTDQGWLDFQDYFVRRRCGPAVREIAYEGATLARPSAALQRGLADHTLRAIVICPSNPMLSIEPILSLPGVRGALTSRTVPVLAVSPLIGGQAVKGPTAKILRELDLAASNATIAARYAGLIDALIVDEADAEAPVPAGIQVVTAPILMNSDADREGLAVAVLAAADRLAGRTR